MSKLMPLPGYILVETLLDEDKTESGLYTPESMKDKPAKGKILEVGESTETEIIEIRRYNEAVGEKHQVLKKPPVEKGQTIIFKRWGGQDIKEGNKELKLVKFDEIMGVYE